MTEDSLLLKVNKKQNSPAILFSSIVDFELIFIETHFLTKNCWFWENPFSREMTFKNSF